MEGEKPYVHFELDAEDSGALSGIHCKIEGQLLLVEVSFTRWENPGA